MVVAYHLVALTAIPGWSRAEILLSHGAQVGVQGFFILSGYLVFASLERSPSIGRYAEKRLRRLYPAYAFVIAASTMAALVFSTPARAEYDAVARYVAWNLAFLNFMQPTLPGLFTGNRFQEVNGSLWTLKIEVLFYLILPLLASALRAAGTMRWAVIIVVYAGVEAWRAGFAHLGTTLDRPLLTVLARQLPGQMSFFITGVALYEARPRTGSLRRLVPAGALLFALSFSSLGLQPLRAAGLGMIVVPAAIAVPRLFDAARFGDLSYGLYIVHFPIIQTVAALGLCGLSPWLGILAALVATVSTAIFVWWVIERPALRRDSPYRIAS